MKDPTEMPVVKQLQAETSKLREIRKGLAVERVVQHETTRKLEEIVARLEDDRRAI